MEGWFRRGQTQWHTTLGHLEIHKRLFLKLLAALEIRKKGFPRRARHQVCLPWACEASDAYTGSRMKRRLVTYMAVLDEPTAVLGSAVCKHRRNNGIVFKDSHELTCGPLNMSRDLNWGKSHLKGRAAERQRRQSLESYI